MIPNLAALVGSRICHDLISPIGAIGNGVELLSLSQAAQTEEMQLIGESVDSASARVRFFRVAFGAAVADQPIGDKEVKTILKDNEHGSRFSYEWDSQNSLIRSEVRIIFLLIQCLESSMPMGGVIRVQQDNASWILTVDSDHLQVDEVLWNNLTESDSCVEYTSAQVQFALVPSALLEARRVVTYAHTSNRITVRI